MEQSEIYKQITITNVSFYIVLKEQHLRLINENVLINIYNLIRNE